MPIGKKNNLKISLLLRPGGEPGGERDGWAAWYEGLDTAQNDDHELFALGAFGYYPGCGYSSALGNNTVDILGF